MYSWGRKNNFIYNAQFHWLKYLTFVTEKSELSYRILKSKRISFLYQRIRGLSAEICDWLRKIEYFCQKDLQRLTWERELELFVQYFDWPLPVFIRF